MSRPGKLGRPFYDRDARAVARDLLGAHVHRTVDGASRVGRIVETEAYLSAGDLACHAHRGVTPRTRLMFGPPGYAYVYQIYGIYHCLNVVTEGEGLASAVLIRALEPVENLEARTQGPGLLCRALGLDRNDSGLDLLGDELYLTAGLPVGDSEIVIGPRIGVEYAGEWAKAPLRFWVQGNPYVSRKGTASRR